MANGDVDVTEGSGLKVGTYTISEDAVTRHIQRVAINTNAGVEVPFNANGAASTANSAPVTFPNDVAAGVTVAVTRTNDTNAYLANDIIGAATGSTAALTFANAGLSARSIMITSTRFWIESTGVISGETSYNLHLYGITPPSALGDNAPWDLPSGDRASYLGVLNLGTPVDLGSTLYVEANGINKQIKLAGTSLFAYLVTVGPYTPTASRVHNIELHTVQL
jgi:hypothetical protein